MNRPNGRPRIYIDTNIFITAFEGDKALSEQLRSIFSKLKEAPHTAVTSEMTLAEVVGKQATFYPWAVQSRFYLELHVFSKIFDLRPISRNILIETGNYRRQADKKIGLVDAIHCVTAVDSGCELVWSADKRFPVPAPLERVAADVACIATIDKMIDARLDG